jgi:predicted HAD superfamily Cof-like phosphohydrolase
MTQEQKNVKTFMTLAGQSTPDKPTIPNRDVLVLRIRLILEELLELAAASGVKMFVGDKELQSTDDVGLIVDAYKAPDLEAIVDAVTDLDYINLGTAVAYGLDLEPFQIEVNRSNMSKFIDGYRREDGKWIKGKSYSPADLKPILEEQKK